MITALLALLAAVTVAHARPFPCNPPPPTNEPMPNITPPRLHPPFFYPEPSPQFLQPPFFYPETRSPPPSSMPNITPPPSGDLPSLQPPFFYPETRSPPPPYLEKGHSPPASWSMFIKKLIIAAGILAAILVLLLALSKGRELDPDTTIQAIGLSVAMTTCLPA